MVVPSLIIMQSPPVSMILERLHIRDHSDVPFCNDTWANTRGEVSDFIESIVASGTVDDFMSDIEMMFEESELEEHVAEILRDIGVHIGPLWERILHCEVASMDGTLHLHVMH